MDHGPWPAQATRHQTNLTPTSAPPYSLPPLPMDLPLQRAANHRIELQPTTPMMTSSASSIFSTDYKKVNASPIPKRRISRRKLQFTTTTNSADDEIESYKLLQQKGIINATASSSSSNKHFTANNSNNNGELICSPMEECEVCPLKWKQFLDKDDEKIKGEFESCTKYERRQKFECTMLFHGEFCVFLLSRRKQPTRLLFCNYKDLFLFVASITSIENDVSDKVAKSRIEYKPCRFTDSDEKFRMLQMQLICLLVGLWSVRNVRRHRMSSASLFDQRRMRGNATQGSGGSSSSDNNGSPSKHVKFSGYSRKDSMESVELGPLIQVTTGAGKVPKSPAPSAMNSV